MAFMTQAQQRAVAARIMRRFSSVREQIPDATKADLFQTIANIDDEYEARQTNFNVAFELPLRQGLSTKQKVEIIEEVLRGIKESING